MTELKIRKNGFNERIAMFIHDNISLDKNNILTFAGHNTEKLAKKYGTPLYLLDEQRIRERCKLYKNAMAEAFGDSSYPLFAGKALCFKGIYKIMQEEQMGIDIVSSGELYTAQKGGFPMERAYFHGSNKTDFDIDFAIENGVGYFICDNSDELTAIDAKAKSHGIVQKIILRLTPGIDTHTHKAISTGRVDSKFGIAIETGQAQEFVGQTLKLKNIELCGFHCHIGSQIFESKPFCDAAVLMLDFIAKMKTRYGFITKILNLGGGLGVRYVEAHPQIDYRARILEIGNLVKDYCHRLNISIPQILMEPGRSIVADAGMTLYTVGGVKEIPGFLNYVSVDGGMTDNPRYALYQSPYTVMLAKSPADKLTYKCTIAGRCCESGDLIQENTVLTNCPQRGDILAVAVTGAYNYAMASNYNRIPRPPIVMLNGENDYIAVEGESFEDLIRNDK